VGVVVGAGVGVGVGVSLGLGLGDGVGVSLGLGDGVSVGDGDGVSVEAKTFVPAVSEVPGVVPSSAPVSSSAGRATITPASRRRPADEDVLLMEPL
jgi:hypothetical protein